MASSVANPLTTPGPGGSGSAALSPSASPKSTASSTAPILSNSARSPPNPPTELKTRTALLLIGLIFVVATAALALVYLSFPDLDPDEAEHVKFPKDIEDAKKLGLVLSHYKDRYFFQVLGGVLVTYLFLQTFAIPGSIFLSIVSGFLFPFPVALLVICFCSATGASFCYLLSYLVGRRLVKTYLPERAASWSEKVQHHQSNLLSYIIFLRITPFLPNWFINIVSPVIDVPLGPFWFGTFVGVAPPSFVAIQAGTTLQQMTSTAEALTFQSVALLVVFALLSIVPVIFRDSVSHFLPMSSELSRLSSVKVE
ncbi:transmembrane protein 41B-like isoform X2 [Tigriopus californicus]|uniref:transmembrane protein 41B-like isoform X2 n=1 Tax=Tigriopus californicus TaxID=6832 RepID=UPI0027D9E7AE|nr:transmembrane protein 41B-like isoform X2 [Tigriopus californicus]